MDIAIIDTSRGIGLIDNKPKGNTIMKSFEVTLSERRYVTRTIEAECGADAEEILVNEFNEDGLDFDYYDNMRCESKESVV